MSSFFSYAARADNDGVIEAPVIHTAYGPKLRVGLACDPEGDRTQQSFKDECDINNIMARYLKAGLLPVSDKVPAYVDTTAIDFQNAQDLVARVRGEFSLLPAAERDAYGNSAELWLDHQAVVAQEALELAEATEKAEAAAKAAAAAVAVPEGPAKASGSPGEPVAPKA